MIEVEKTEMKGRGFDVNAKGVIEGEGWYEGEVTVGGEAFVVEDYDTWS
jgi:hypothetical protein